MEADRKSSAKATPANERRTHVWFWGPDESFAQLVSRALGPSFEVHCCQDFQLEQAKELCSRWDVVLLDLRGTRFEAEKDPGLTVMNDLSQVDLCPPIVVMLEEEERALSLKAIENGAFDTTVGLPNIPELRLVLRRASKFAELQKLLHELSFHRSSFTQLHELIGASEGMQRVFALAQKVAPCDVNLLVTGETGTGKELLARAIHRLSPRSSFPFVAFSCASLPESLIEDELFGHEKGAFTGAIMTRRGRFEVADKGTLFLDEIGDLGAGLQSKLLRVLQQRSFERLGSSTSLTTDTRLVSATHRNLSEMVEQGKFREDLFYRLNVVEINIPPLRERREDIPFLAYYFLRHFARQFGRKIKRYSPIALHALEEYGWPGNVRELENVTQRAVVMAEGSTVEVWHLPPALQKGFERQALLEANSYEAEVREFKRRLILRTLRETGWCKQDAARSLGLARSYLHRLINQLEIPAEETEALQELMEGLPPTGQVM